MSFESFIALRYLMARSKQTFISVISVTSILGVALGVASLIVVLGVMNGFTKDLRDKILGVNAHAITMSIGGGIANYESVMEKVQGVPDITGVTPFIYSEVMISTASGVKGLVLRGVDPATAEKVLSIREHMEDGSFASLEQDGMPGIIIGKELAQRLGVGIGGRVNLLSPTGTKTATGFTPRVRICRIVGLFKTGMWEYDSSLGFVSLGFARDLLGWKGDTVTGLEMTVRDVYRADKVAENVTAALGGYPYYSRNWMEMNANLFAALKLEKTAMGIILTLIVLVGSFSIVTTLVMLVMEKTRDIAILMSMGATRSQIRRIFMLQGTIIGAIGTIIGFGLGLSVAYLLKRYQFIELPKGVYSLDTLPVLIEWTDLLIIGVSAMVLCFVATIYPARQAARLEPVEALRYE
ncbi:lipoprotein-releasing ABC transporter permease subunit [Desulfovibrio subterraneus]|jgi:lipoprotein-releasing system permease protein|uniref:ABC transporter permease n=1 Tax=Desulfovibrio subterraneus TaxID=2718620 RepID=A0A7J0BF10_9BACT|nr:lipoprotein-releasing ABC transporter permease subunit [Desulfovibrio subterraneus]WBF68600.1 lipoprotein-releasing ABC transporter permease subunit [Desulfovibrio subterraneus]GFM31772.1 ABC transporter permease [Desulfovibrio subterraneus]